MFWEKVPSPLDEAYERAVRELNACVFGSQEYVRTMKLVQQLYEMKEKEKPSSVSKDTLAIVGANLLGIIMIISHEHVGNAVTSRAFGLLMRTR